MSEILFKSEAGEAEPAEDHANEAGAVALSADEFSALEERVLRAVELVKRERSARVEAEERAAKAEAAAGEHGAELDRLERDLKQLRAERDHVRERVEKLLKQLEAIEL
jgi:chromosome segregation ATPase